MEASAQKIDEVVVVDGEGCVAGRLASYVAKMLLDGKRVMVVNAEKILLSGKRDMIVDEWLKSLEISSRVHPKYGPFHPRTPNGIFTRMVRGMVPRKKPKGRSAMKRLRVYLGVPDHCRRLGRVEFDDVKARKPIAYYLSLGELAKAIGWRGE